MLRHLCIAALISLVAASVPAREIQFSGYSWLVRDSGGQAGGPGPNVFSGMPDAVAVLADGGLRLSILKAGSGWSCAEVILPQALGYGTYEIEVENNPADLDRQAVFGFFSYDSSPEQSHRELDVELSYWGKQDDDRNSQFVVQPDGPGQKHRFTVNERGTSYRIHWTRGVAEFTALSSDGSVLQHWVQREAVPDAAAARIDLNLWLAKGLPPQTGENVEFVVKRFRFTPERQ
ncbi:glycoside hydrolase family 16 protein [Paraburkholderia sp. A3RO-2L]|uniref:glycoside hydrolase family 16 protein n=1 Tax=unclassified Paraburkholderia TaxID=2615204 RepID=UPI003DA7D5B9